MLPLWLSIFGLLLSVVIVTGNGLVFYLIVTRRNLRTTANWFVLSLAVADFGVGVANSVTLLTGCYIRLLCFSHISTAMLYLVYASITNLCALTLDRYLAIIKPLRYITFMTMKRVVLLVAVSWGLPLLIFLVPLLALELGTSGQTYVIFKKYFLVFLSFFQVCVCFALLFATTRIFLVARRHARQNAVLVMQLNFNHRIQHSRVFKPQEAASTKVVGSVVAVFIICYVLNLYDDACIMGLCKRSETIRFVLILLKLSNSAVNPVAYAIFKKDIKKELKRLLCYLRGKTCSYGGRQNRIMAAAQSS